MSGLPSTQMRVVLAKRPQGTPKEGEDLVFEKSAEMPKAKEGQVVVKNLSMSLDPAMRTQMSIRTYVEPMPIGSTVRSTTVGEVVVAAGHLRVGDLVLGPGGWQEYYASKPKWLQPLTVPAGLPASVALGVLGPTGLTAYFGLLKVGQPKATDTVLVSGAGGATGNVVCQIAKHILGCRVIGITGGPDKCKFLLNELGLDGAIDYKSEKDLSSAIKRCCPKGVDVYFDNVGGDQLNAALRRMNLFGRVVCCGSVGGYNKMGSGEPTGPGIPANVASSIISSRIKMQGFIVNDWPQDTPHAYKELGQWLHDGKIKNHETVYTGLENAGRAFRGLFEGANTGKLTVRIAEPTHQSKL